MIKTIWIINQYESTPDTGLAGRHFNLADILANRGYTVYGISASYTHILRKPLALSKWYQIEKYKHLNWIWLKMPSYKHAHSKKRIYNWLLFSMYLMRLGYINDIAKPDFIIASSPSPFVYFGAKHLAGRFNAKLIFDVRDIWPLSLCEIGNISKKHPLMRVMQYLEDKAYKNADVITSNLPYAYKHMKERGMNEEKFLWLPNGIKKNNNDKGLPISDLCKNKSFKIGYAGTFGSANEILTFLKAAKLLKKYKDISIILIGQGKNKKQLISFVKENLLTNVNFIDPVPKDMIFSHLRRLDVCYIGLKKSPVFRFGVSPNKLFDYFLSARPIIYAVDSGDYLPVNEAKAGISIQPGNPKELADAILYLKSLTPIEREQMGKNGQAYVLKHHDYEKIADKLETILK